MELKLNYEEAGALYVLIKKRQPGFFLVEDRLWYKLAKALIEKYQYNGMCNDITKDFVLEDIIEALKKPDYLSEKYRKRCIDLLKKEKALRGLREDRDEFLNSLERQ